MITTNPDLRLLRPVALTSLLLLGLCAFTAVFLLREQAGATAALRENIVSRRAAADLEESLIDLIGLERARVESVATLHQRIDKHIATIMKHADKEEERRIADLLIQSYERYLKLWNSIAQTQTDRGRVLKEAALLLETETLKRCQELEEYNTTQIEGSEEEHRQSLRWLAWGMAGVGVTGAVAGLLLGYGVARSFRQSINRLQVQIRDVTGKLGPRLPEIVLTGEGNLSGLEGQVQELLRSVEQVVGELQQREREVLHSEQLAAVGQLAAGVAHEIRNPLTSINMLIQAGREDASGLPAEDLTVIEQEIRRMDRSLQVLLDFARLPKPQRSDQDIKSIAARTLDLIRGRATKQGVELKLTSSGGSTRIHADGEQLQQVFVNLSLNALDLMPSGGTLEIAIHRGRDAIEVKVLDTGPGILPEMMPKLFEPFYSSKETGVGLGLVISRRIIEEHGGELNAANRIGGGACFTFVLPTDNKD